MVFTPEGEDRTGIEFDEPGYYKELRQSVKEVEGEHDQNILYC